MRHSFLVAVGLSLTAVQAAASGGVQVELNKLEPVGDGCRIYLLLKNEAPQAFESLKLDLVLFDRETVVARRLAVETAPLPANKTLLKVFDLPQLPCTDLGRVLINDVLTCERGDGGEGECLGLVDTSSRADVDLIK